ncbi:MAG: hypothetical protein GXO76_09060 [Calditrichaeota bacterium]|nr:hypothetical protein [Calditrichota bacterium]
MSLSYNYYRQFSLNHEKKVTRFPVDEGLRAHRDRVFLRFSKSGLNIFPNGQL